MKFDLSVIELSKSDIKREVKLPEFLNCELAEFIGIVIGDGHLSFNVGKQKGGTPLVRSDIAIACNKNEQQYIQYIIGLFYSLFKIKLSYEIDKRSDTVLLKVHSKGIIQFLNKLCEIPLNKKTDIVFVPNIIKNSSKEVKCAFLRGLADTDFTLTFQNRTGKGHNYPVIKPGFKSKVLVQDLEKIFTNLGFKCNTSYGRIRTDKRFSPTTTNEIYICGRENLKKWNTDIGFSNPKFHRRLEKWHTDGICPPRY